LVILPVLLLVSAVVCIAIAVVICWIVRSNPWDGGWMFGLLAAPFALSISILAANKFKRTRN
jgi:hypothetical protein